MEEYKKIEELKEEYLVKTRTLSKFQINYQGFEYKNFVVLEPITFFSFKSATANAGWIVKNKTNNLYSIVPNVQVVKAYNDVYATKTYFGIRYGEFEVPFLVSRELVDDQLISQKEKFNMFGDFEERHKENMKVFDNCIKHFKSLDKKEFNKSLNKLVKMFNFHEINDTNKHKNCLYILVFDKYKQYYVGSAKNLSNRTKKHWSAIMDPVRFSWRGGQYSRINVDTFRMKDNTRIFVCDNPKSILISYKDKNTRFLETTNTFGIYKYEEMSELEKAERIVINSCDIKFCLSDRIPIDAQENKIEEYLKKNC